MVSCRKYPLGSFNLPSQLLDSPHVLPQLRWLVCLLLGLEDVTLLQLLYSPHALPEGTHEGSLVLGSLEPSMSELGAGVDELEADLLQGPLLGVGQERLPQGEGALLGANAATLAGQGQLSHGKTAKSKVKEAVSNNH